MTLCLNMIVKDEARVIARCLDSVKPFIDAWCIVDTGSTDGTQDLIRAHLSGVPGELHERPWKDFAHNRNEAIELARDKSDYLLVMDADDVLVAPDGFAMPSLEADSYKLLVENAGMTYWRTQIFKLGMGFHYEGVLHEVLLPDADTRLEGLVYKCSRDSARCADPRKYEKDAAILEAALYEEPRNARYAFYLAQSWRDAGRADKARAAYELRAAMPGFEEETWYSLLEVAKLSACLGRESAVVIDAYLRAYERRPSRAESLCYLAMYLRQHDRVAAGYPFAHIAASTPRPDDILFIDDAVYTWRSKDECAVAAFYAGRREEALALNEKLLESGTLPENEKERVRRNLDFCRTQG